MARKKKSFDQLAQINARLETRKNRASALPASRSCIPGRSFAKVQEQKSAEPETVEAEVFEQDDAKES